MFIWWIGLFEKFFDWMFRLIIVFIRCFFIFFGILFTFFFIFLLKKFLTDRLIDFNVLFLFFVGFYSKYLVWIFQFFLNKLQKIAFFIFTILVFWIFRDFLIIYLSFFSASVQNYIQKRLAFTRLSFFSWFLILWLILLSEKVVAESFLLRKQQRWIIFENTINQITSVFAF